MVNYYRKFIDNCASLQAPLTRLLNRCASRHWGDEEEAAKVSLCLALADTASLRLPNLTRRFTIQTDASDFGLGAVLLQEGDEPHLGLRPVAFACIPALTSTERNYTVAEKGCLAILFALKEFVMIVEGTSFTVEGDHQALVWLSRLQEPSGRHARWCPNNCNATISWYGARKERRML